MTVKLRFLAFMMLGGAASAAPVPPPPQDYQGGQYIDGQGCVFTRAGSDWSARTDGAGQPLCGFPPSLDARRTDPEADRVLPLTRTEVPADPQTLLMEQLSQELRSGEWASDPAAPQQRAAPEPARRPDPMSDVLRDALAAAPSMRAAAGLSASPELCARLGYKAPADADAQSPGLGLCPGMQAGPTMAAIPAATTEPAPQPKRQTAVQTPSAPKHAPTVRQQPAAQAAAVVASRRTQPARKPEAGPEMIPPTARYVQVGAYADGDNAMIVLRALAARGYPTGQARSRAKTGPMRVIMAGPFADRQALIRALNDLRANGYPGAVAR
ncbi:SPOR domain-containing protein [Paracoccus rhizosphaerae]|uniref:SPOR domain-containing protein n=1 Tax=Paracoccus rhizosphaerae TaxID=1133347 RepID=A0ABV6CPH5_9RHOB|nr:SPOR domain-containing protein [Paracoccus rhizosphaerae]